MKFLITTISILILTIMVSGCSVKSGGLSQIGTDKIVVDGQPQKSESMMTKDGDQNMTVNGAAPLQLKVDRQGLYKNAQGTGGEFYVDGQNKTALITSQADAFGSASKVIYHDGITSYTAPNGQLVFHPKTSLEMYDIAWQFNKKPQDEVIRDAYRESALALMTVAEIQKQESVENTEAVTDASQTWFQSILTALGL